MIQIPIALLHERALTRPLGYLEAVYDSACVAGDSLLIDDPDYMALCSRYGTPLAQDDQLRRLMLCRACEMFSEGDMYRCADVRRRCDRLRFWDPGESCPRGVW